MRPPQFLPIRVEMQGDERLYYQAHQQLMKLLLVEAHSTPCWPAQEQGPQPRRFAIRIQYPVQCCCALGTDAGGSAALPVPLGPLHLLSVSQEQPQARTNSTPPVWRTEWSPSPRKSTCERLLDTGASHDQALSYHSVAALSKVQLQHKNHCVLCLCVCLCRAALDSADRPSMV